MLEVASPKELVRRVLGEIAQCGEELVRGAQPREIAALAVCCARLGLRDARFFGAVAAAAVSPRFLRRCNGPILAGVAWALSRAGFRCPPVIHAAAARLLTPSLAPLSPLSPKSIRLLLWACSASLCYHRRLYDALCIKLSAHVPPPTPFSSAADPELLSDVLWSLAAVRHYDSDLIGERERGV